MNESEYLASENPLAMIAHLHEQGLISDWQCRLFACACCLANGTPLNTIAAYEQGFHLGEGYFAITDKSFAETCAESNNLPMPLRAHLLREVVGNPWRPIKLPHDWMPWKWTEVCRRQCGVERRSKEMESIYGPEQSCISAHWLTSTVRGLAQSIYDSRQWHDLPILADALEDAGCEEEELLRHLRGEERCPRCVGTGTVEVDLGIKGGPELGPEIMYIMEPPKTCPFPCADCHGTGWIPLRGDHARGCWALEICRGGE